MPEIPLEDEGAFREEMDSMVLFLEEGGERAARSCAMAEESKLRLRLPPDSDPEVPVDVDFTQEPAALEAMLELADGAALCLRALFDAVPARAAFVHVCNVHRSEFEVVAARGPGAELLVGARHSTTDPLISAALRAGGPVLGNANGPEGPLWVWRLFAVAPIESVIVAPAMHAGRLVGLIELAGAVGAEPFTDQEVSAVACVAERFGEFVATRSLA
jgi:hypothetical protein